MNCVSYNANWSSQQPVVENYWWIILEIDKLPKKNSLFAKGWKSNESFQQSQTTNFLTWKICFMFDLSKYDTLFKCTFATQQKVNLRLMPPRCNFLPSPCSPLQSSWLNSYVVLITDPFSGFLLLLSWWVWASLQSNSNEKSDETFCVKDVTNPNFACMALPAGYSFIRWAPPVCQRPNTSVGVLLSHHELSSLQMTDPSRRCVLNFKHHQLSGL